MQLRGPVMKNSCWKPICWSVKNSRLRRPFYFRWWWWYDDISHSSSQINVDFYGARSELWHTSSDLGNKEHFFDRRNGQQIKVCCCAWVPFITRTSSLLGWMSIDKRVKTRSTFVGLHFEWHLYISLPSFRACALHTFMSILYAHM